MVMTPDDLEKIVRVDIADKVQKLREHIAYQLKVEALKNGMSGFICTIDVDEYPQFVVDDVIKEYMSYWDIVPGWKAAKRLLIFKKPVKTYNNGPSYQEFGGQSWLDR